MYSGDDAGSRRLCQISHDRSHFSQFGDPLYHWLSKPPFELHLPCPGYFRLLNFHARKENSLEYSPLALENGFQGGPSRPGRESSRTSQSNVSFPLPRLICNCNSISRLTLCRLYCTNLPDKLRKYDLRLSLYTLFSTYGTVLDVVAMKTSKMRGQAHIVFKDVQASTQAMRALQGFEFFGQEMVRYA